MNILITGANGFIGKNLTAALWAIRDGLDKTHPALTVDEVFCYDIDTDPAKLADWCARCDFVFHLAGVNRPKDTAEFMAGNAGFTDTLLNTLRACGNTCPVVLSSSTQAALDNPYGESKRAGEALLSAYGEETGASVLIYRFPNVFGKWCRPNYNSAVATFCHNLARDLPITVNDPAVTLTLVYIDDVVEELLSALLGTPHRDDERCAVPVTHTVTLGRIVELIRSFCASRAERSLPDLGDPFTKKLHATFLSYLPADALGYDLTMNVDARGSFTEMLRTPERGQLSINVSKPHITKGQHWHHTKNEKFLVVSGTGVIRFRSAMPGGDDAVTEYFVSGDRLQVIDIPTGYTHNIENLGDTDMVTVMWCSECFDPNRPDTFFLPV